MSIASAKTGVLAQARMFLNNQVGGMAVPMGIAMIPIFMATGVGIDAVRITREQAAFQAALDAATLALAADERTAVEGLTGNALTTRIAELEALALKYAKANYTREAGSNAQIIPKVYVDGQKVQLKATLNFPTTLMRYAGINTLDLHFFSEVQKAMRPVEVTMVMDVTGSMSQSITVGTPLPPGITSSTQIDTKIEGAKYAAKNFLKSLYSGTLAEKPSSQYIRVSMVPFSAAVRLNTAAHDFKLNWIDTAGANTLSRLHFDQSIAPPTTWNNYTAWSSLKKTSSTYHSWNGCVETRRNGTGTSDFNINDTAPSAGNPDTLFPAYFMPDVSGTSTGGGTNNYGVNYIGGTSLTSTGSECRGLSFCDKASASGSTNNANFYRSQQENYYKYVDRLIGNEAITTDGPWTNCSATSVVPMTYDRSKVEAAIDAMVPHGSTVIPEGLSWGLRVISPTEPFTKVEGFGSQAAANISIFNDPRWIKVMLLMTDGNNDIGPGSFTTNSSWYAGYGFAGEALANNRYGTTSSSAVETNLNDFTAAACNKVKANNVTLFVSSFGNGVSTATQTMLRNCATSPTHYLHAATSANLIAAFDHFGQDTLNKMIFVSK
jgi:Flp pilus assembly protein TadG